MLKINVDINHGRIPMFEYHSNGFAFYESAIHSTIINKKQRILLYRILTRRRGSKQPKKNIWLKPKPFQQVITAMPPLYHEPSQS